MAGDHHGCSAVRQRFERADSGCDNPDHRPNASRSAANPAPSSMTPTMIVFSPMCGRIASRQSIDHADTREGGTGPGVDERQRSDDRHLGRRGDRRSSDGQENRRPALGVKSSSLC